MEDRTIVPPIYILQAKEHDKFKERAIIHTKVKNILCKQYLVTNLRKGWEAALLLL